LLPDYQSDYQVNWCLPFDHMPSSARIHLSRQAARQIQTGNGKRPLLVWKRLGDRRVFVMTARRSGRGASGLHPLMQKSFMPARSGAWSMTPNMGPSARMARRSCCTFTSQQYFAIQLASEVAALEWRRSQPQRIVQKLHRGASPIVSTDSGAVATKVDHMGLWRAVQTFPKRQPFWTNVLISMCAYSGADYCIQKSSGDPIDKTRLSNFMVFGMFQGCVSWTFYVRIVSKLVPSSVRFTNLSFAEKMRDRAGQVGLLQQTFLDNFVYTPFVFFPIFYSVKALVQGDSKQLAVEKYCRNFEEDNIASCMVWLWADPIMFSLPAWVRMPFFQGVNFGYVSLLSYMRGSSGEPKAEVHSGVVASQNHGHCVAPPCQLLSLASSPR